MLLSIRAVVLVACAGAALLMGPARAQGPQVANSDAVLKAVGLDQKLNAQIPYDLTFRDETGRTVRLGEYFGKKPVMMILIQYRCTMLCSEEMKILAESLKQLQFT